MFTKDTREETSVFQELTDEELSHIVGGVGIDLNALVNRVASNIASGNNVVIAPNTDISPNIPITVTF